MDFINLIEKIKEKLTGTVSDSERNEYYKNIGFCHYKLKKYNEAIEWFNKINPKDISVLKSLAAIYYETNRFNESNIYAELCLQLNFDIDIAYDTALHYTRLTKYHQALGLYETILDLQPNHINALNNVAEIYNCLMNPKKAIECYEKAYDLDNSRMDIYSNLIMTTYYVYRYSPVKRLKYTSKFNEMLGAASRSRQAQALARQAIIKPQKPLATTKRGKLRIGYLGYDFDKLDHPITCFVKHIIENHKKFKVYCYQASGKKATCFYSTDNEFYTDKINGVTTRNLSDLSSEEAAKVIYDDEIDILVELMHHTAGNRLDILSYKPAPIQISYCAHPGTTGMESIDYKILDNITYNNSVNRNYSETALLMNNGFHCFVPTYEFPTIISKRLHPFVTFCSFNNLKKMNEKVIETWLHILRLVPGSHLYLRYYHYTSSFIKEYVKQRFLEKSKEMLLYKFDINRIHFIGYNNDYTQVLKLYGGMDIFLDTFPYTGTTVISEALNASIPVITLMGKQPHERVGASLVSSIGCPELIATNEREYIDKAVILAKSAGTIQAYKNTIKKKVKNSILGDPKLFIKEYEEKLMDTLELI